MSAYANGHPVGRLRTRRGLGRMPATREQAPELPLTEALTSVPRDAFVPAHSVSSTPFTSLSVLRPNHHLRARRRSRRWPRSLFPFSTYLLYSAVSGSSAPYTRGTQPVCSKHSSYSPIATDHKAQTKLLNHTSPATSSAMSMYPSSRRPTHRLLNHCSRPRCCDVP